MPSPLARRDLLAAGAAGLAGAAVLGLAGARTASADRAFDVQLLQTAASIENALVSAYETIVALPVLGSPPTAKLKELLTNARNHHGDHAKAFNDAVGKLGGRPQTAPNPTVAQTAGRARLVDVSQIVDLAHDLETVAAQTYQNDVGLLEDLNARKLSASILAVEAQHAAALGVIRALLSASQPDLIGTDTGSIFRFPPDAPRAGSPDSFTPVELARPAAEGAIR